MPNSTSDIIKAEARGLGFDVARITGAHGVEDGGERLRQFLEQGRHGTMTWMENRASWRADPLQMWPDAKSAILLGTNYGPTEDPREALARTDSAAISVYARGDDYHDVVKKNLKALAGFIHQRFKAEVKVFVDTAPVMEKPLAARAGLGWAGKHTNLVSRQFGSWLFLGSVFTTLALEADAPESDHCGSCRACLEACPTKAFPAPYQLDARRCISYLTIEHHGPIPRPLRAAMGNRIYGCDDCLAACPWNSFARAASEIRLQARAGLNAPRLADLAALDDAAFRALFRKNPVKRIGRDRFIRNVMIAIGNSGSPSLAGAAQNALQDPSPVVRGAAVWALSRLLAPDAFAALARDHANEPDGDVRAEWGFIR